MKMNQYEARAALEAYLTDTVMDNQIEAAERAAAEEREWEAATLEALRTMDHDDPCYSDLYKDLYGVRPRW